MEQLQVLITQLGLPIAMLICVGWYFVKQNERFQSESKAANEQMRLDYREDKEELMTLVKEGHKLHEELSKTNHMLCADLKLTVDGINDKLDKVLGDK